MNKYALSLLLLLITASVMGQRAPAKKTKVTLRQSTSVEIVTRPNGTQYQKVKDGVFVQDYSTMIADSVLFYPDLNAFDAFGHVNINQGDTLNVFSDKLNYNGNTKIAILTNNVKLVDKDATLTTNHFTYNTATRYGTYIGGGKLVNADNTLVSKTGYYFASSRDAYFRYDVVTTTVDATIKTDTMRYNSGSRITYFYGPTHIYGKKDKDTLYTESGTYNTKTEQAYFVKNNLYSQGSKSLKGDTLFYDRLKGYGRANRNVVFNDNEQKTTIYGHKGEYFKADERAQITKNPYMVFITEEKDTTKTAPVKIDSIANSTKTNADTVGNKQSAAKTTLPIVTGKVVNVKADSTDKNLIIKAPEKIKRDSLFLVADTLETQIITFKEYKDLQFQRWLASNKDTSIKIKPLILYKTPPKVLTITRPKMPVDSSMYHVDIFGKPKPPPAPKATPVAKSVIPVLTAKDSLRIKQKADSLKLKENNGLSDTSRIRIVNAFFKAKLYKSDLQSVADSMSYASSDSIIRSYKKPMIWTQGSQLSGDTVYLQMKNKKIDNITLFPAGFIVNIEKQDSLHFNQIGGKKIYGEFKDNRLALLRVTGNAETIYFNRDTVTNQVTEMQQSTSGSLKVHFKGGKLTNMTFSQSPLINAFPYKDVKDEDKILKGFIWKPKDRPVSKEAIIPPPLKAINTKPSGPKTPPAKKPAAKSVPKKVATGKPGLNTTIPKPAKDTTARDGTAITQPAIIKKDTTVKK